jgi:hypothetical protein
MHCVAARAERAATTMDGQTSRALSAARLVGPDAAKARGLSPPLLAAALAKVPSMDPADIKGEAPAIVGVDAGKSGVAGSAPLFHLSMCM